MLSTVHCYSMCINPLFAIRLRIQRTVSLASIQCDPELIGVLLTWQKAHRILLLEAKPCSSSPVVQGLEYRALLGTEHLWSGRSPAQSGKILTNLTPPSLDGHREAQGPL